MRYSRNIHPLLLGVVLVASQPASAEVPGASNTMTDSPLVYLHNYWSVGSPGNGGDLLTVDPDGFVYVRESSLIRKYTGQGELVDSWAGVGIGELAPSRSGDLYGVRYNGTNTTRIGRYSDSGALLSDWFVDALIQNIAVDTLGNVHATEWASDQVRRFTSAGAALPSWTAPPYISKIACTPGGFMYLLHGGVISKYDLEGNALAAWPVGATDFVVKGDDTLYVSVALPNDALIEMGPGGVILGSMAMSGLRLVAYDPARRYLWTARPYHVRRYGEDPPLAPVGRIGGPHAAECAGDTTIVYLDGSASSDPEGSGLTYQWSVTGTGATMLAALSPKPRIRVLSQGVCDRLLQVRMEVKDITGAATACTTAVQVADRTPPVLQCVAERLSGSSVRVRFAAEDLCGSAATSAIVEVGSGPVPVANGEVVDLADAGGPVASATLRVDAVDGCGNRVESVQELVAPPVEEGLPQRWRKPRSLALSVDRAPGRAAAIRYALPEPAEVRLAVFDVAGRRVAEVASGVRAAGEHRASWDGGGLSAGVYFLRLTAGGASRSVVLRVE